MHSVEFRKSRLKNLGLLVIGIGLVAASILAANIGDDRFIRGVGWFGAAFFGLAIVKALMNLFSTEVVYVIDERGIDDRQSGIGLIPWSAITRIETLTMRGTRFVMLSLDHPEHYLARVSPTKRRLASFNQAVGWGDWSLAFVGISPSVDEAEKVIERFSGQSPAA